MPDHRRADGDAIDVRKGGAYFLKAVNARIEKDPAGGKLRAVFKQWYERPLRPAVQDGTVTEGRASGLRGGLDTTAGPCGERASRGDRT